MPKRSPQGLRVLGGEGALSGASSLNRSRLINSKVAIINTEAPRDIITANDRKGSSLEPLGILLPNLPKPTGRSFAIYCNKSFRTRHRGRAKLTEKHRKAGKEKTIFEWAGDSSRTRTHYYRIQRSNVSMEYETPRIMRTHVHAVWPQFPSDFAKTAPKHYEQVTTPNKIRHRGATGLLL